MPFIRDTSYPVVGASGDAVAKAARTVTGDSGWIDIGSAAEVIAQIDSDAGSGTSPTLDIKIQTSFNGTNATAVDVPTGAFTQIAAAASMQIKSVTVMHRFIKINWVIGGTAPSFNFGAYITARK